MSEEFEELTDENSGMQVMKDYIKDFVTKRNWTKNQRPMNLALSVSVEAAELLEIFQWEDPSDMLEDPARMQHCKEEMADVLIYLINLANVLDIDLMKATVDKMENNGKRFTVEDTYGNW